MKTISQVVRITGTSAERALLLDKDVDDNTIIEFSETDTGDKYEWDGNSWTQTRTNGATRSRPIYGTGEDAKNRNINAAATTYAEATNSCAWTESDNVTEFFVTVTSPAPVSGQDAVLMLIDPPSAAYCTSAFADTGGRSVDVAYYRLQYGLRNGPFTGVSWFTSLAFLPTDADTRIVVEAQ